MVKCLNGAEHRAGWQERIYQSLRTCKHGSPRSTECWEDNSEFDVDSHQWGGGDYLWGGDKGNQGRLKIGQAAAGLIAAECKTLQVWLGGRYSSPDGT